MGMDVRVCDLFPDIPMADDSNVLEIYADNVAELKHHGANFTATYFVWGKRGPAGLVQRIPVVKIIRPCASVFGAVGGFIGRRSLSIVPLVPN